jgi:hypothetical protein
MAAHKRISRLNRLFHKPAGYSHRHSPARRRLLKFFQFTAQMAARIVPTVENTLACRELTFKIRAFSFFEHVDIFLDLDPDSPWPIEEAVKKIQALEPENRVWALEGVGYIYAERALKQKETPEGILQNINLPHWSSGGLHSGMGMVFANRFLQNFKDQNSLSISFKTIERYLALVRENSLPSCAGIPLDSLGFIARLMFPEQVPLIDKRLQKMEKNLAAYFWHGVGRALFFLPGNMWPGRSFPWRAVEMAPTEAPHEFGYLNILSGLAWPLTLVNLREPRITENVLKYHRERLSKNEAFSNGVSSAIVFLTKSIGSSPLIDSFLNHNPASSEPRLREDWERLVKTPCQKALNSHPHQENRNSWSKFFLYK